MQPALTDHKCIWPRNSAYCYTELAISSQAVAMTTAATRFACPSRDGQAELAAMMTTIIVTVKGPVFTLSVAKLAQPLVDAMAADDEGTETHSENHILRHTIH